MLFTFKSILRGLWDEGQSEPEDLAEAIDIAIRQVRDGGSEADEYLNNTDNNAYCKAIVEVILEMLDKPLDEIETIKEEVQKSVICQVSDLSKVQHGELWLDSFMAAGTNKIGLIKDIRDLTYLGLKEAKDLADLVGGYHKICNIDNNQIINKREFFNKYSGSWEIRNYD